LSFFRHEECVLAYSSACFRTESFILFLFLCKNYLILLNGLMCLKEAVDEEMLRLIVIKLKPYRNPILIRGIVFYNSWTILKFYEGDRITNQ
jgi:hypothetical protein